jgi:hypothetical protein
LGSSFAALQLIEAALQNSEAAMAEGDMDGIAWLGIPPQTGDKQLFYQRIVAKIGREKRRKSGPEGI